MDELASNDLSTALAVGKSERGRCVVVKYQFLMCVRWGLLKAPGAYSFSRKLRRRNSVNGILHAEFQLQVTE